MFCSRYVINGYSDKRQRRMSIQYLGWYSGVCGGVRAWDGRLSTAAARKRRRVRPVATSFRALPSAARQSPAAVRLLRERRLQPAGSRDAGASSPVAGQQEANQRQVRRCGQDVVAHRWRDARCRANCCCYSYHGNNNNNNNNYDNVYAAVIMT